jgi:hypothetical protein
MPLGLGLRLLTVEAIAGCEVRKGIGFWNWVEPTLPLRCLTLGKFFDCASLHLFICSIHAMYLPGMVIKK